MRPTHLIVIGASAGGVEALKELFARMPADLPAAVCIVMHISPILESHLPEILNLAGPLRAHHLDSKEAIVSGKVYIAPPDRHLIVNDGTIEVSNAPKENRHRPAVNPLFRSAASAFGPKTIGVILSGVLDDGTAGLWQIKQSGGTAVVQDPHDAPHSDMPLNAINSVQVDYVVPIKEMAQLLAKLCNSEVEP